MSCANTRGWEQVAKAGGTPREFWGGESLRAAQAGREGGVGAGLQSSHARMRVLVLDFGVCQAGIWELCTLCWSVCVCCGTEPLQPVAALQHVVMTCPIQLSSRDDVTISQLEALAGIHSKDGRAHEHDISI
eukprot:1755039-Rhodomonas_salina.2